MKRLGLFLIPALLGGCAAVGVNSPNHGFDDGNLYQYAARPLSSGQDAELTVWAPYMGLGQPQLYEALSHYAAREAQARGCTSYQLSNQTSGITNTLWRGQRYVRGNLLCTVAVPPAPVVTDMYPPIYSAPVAEPLVRPALKPTKAPARKKTVKKTVKKKKPGACACPAPTPAAKPKS